MGDSLSKSTEVSVKYFSDFYTPITLAELEKHIYTEKLSDLTIGVIQVEVVVVFAYWVQRIQDKFKGITATYANDEVPVFRLMDFSTVTSVSKFVILEAFAFLKFTGVVLDEPNVMIYFHQGIKVGEVNSKSGCLNFLVNNANGCHSQGALNLTIGSSNCTHGCIDDNGITLNVIQKAAIIFDNLTPSSLSRVESVTDYFQIPVGAAVNINTTTPLLMTNGCLFDSRKGTCYSKIRRTAENRVVETRYHASDTKPISKVVREFIGGKWVAVEGHYSMNNVDDQTFKRTYDPQGRVIKDVFKENGVCGISTTSYICAEHDPNKVRYIRKVTYNKGTPRRLRRVSIKTPSSNTAEFMVANGTGDFTGRFMPNLVETFTECKRADDKISSEFNVPIYKWTYHDGNISTWCLGGIGGIEIFKSAKTDTKGVREATTWYINHGGGVVEIDSNDTKAQVLVSSVHGKILAVDYVSNEHGEKNRYLMTRHVDDGVLESVCCENPELIGLEVIELVQ